MGHVLEVRVDLLPQVPRVLALADLLELGRLRGRRLERLLLLGRRGVRRGELVVGEEDRSSAERREPGGAEGCAEEGHDAEGRRGRPRIDRCKGLSGG